MGNKDIVLQCPQGGGNLSSCTASLTGTQGRVLEKHKEYQHKNGDRKE